MIRYRALRLAAFWVAMLFAYVSALVPGEEAPTLGSSDKIDHVTAFLVLTLLARLAYPRRPEWLIAIALSAFGAFIEISQAIPLFHRDASVLDWVADSGAIVVGLAIAAVAGRRMPRLFAG